jgi:hypothetical protein
MGGQYPMFDREASAGTKAAAKSNLTELKHQNKTYFDTE